LPNITTRTARARLAARREPHWLKLGAGRALGFRAGPGTWIARLTSGDGRKTYKALADVGPDADYNAAKLAAESWFALTSGTARRVVRRGTVRSALAAYLWQLRRIGRRNAAISAAALFKLVIDDGIGVLKLESVQRDDVEAWRNRLRIKGRAPRSTNRYTRQVIAAIRLAIEELGHTGNLRAWDLTALSDDVEESGEAAVFLTAEQRAQLIAKCTQALANFLTGLEHTGARPSELAVATARDFDPASGTLTLRSRKGRPVRLKARGVMLSSEGAQFFRAQARDKTPSAPLITNAHDGGHWTRQEWAKGIRKAATAANEKAKAAQRIPAGVSAYSFRHARISELLQIYGVDPLTVASQTGTSLSQMEKYYFKFVPSAMRDKLDAVKAAT
jgi:integrase